jgi:riboflavin transporter FmnP
MYFQDAVSNNFIHCTTAAPGGALQIGFFNTAPVIQPTNAIAGAVFVANAGAAVNVASTFDGYTIAQLVTAVRSLGLAA